MIWVLIVCTRNVHLQFKRCNINSKDGVVGCLDRAVKCKVRKVKGRSGRSKGRNTRKCLEFWRLGVNCRFFLFFFCLFTS